MLAENPLEKVVKFKASAAAAAAGTAGGVEMHAVPKLTPRAVAVSRKPTSAGAAARSMAARGKKRNPVAAQEPSTGLRRGQTLTVGQPYSCETLTGSVGVPL